MDPDHPDLATETWVRGILEACGGAGRWWVRRLKREEGPQAWKPQEATAAGKAVDARAVNDREAAGKSSAAADAAHVGSSGRSGGRTDGRRDPVDGIRGGQGFQHDDGASCCDNLYCPAVQHGPCGQRNPHLEGTGMLLCRGCTSAR